MNSPTVTAISLDATGGGVAVVARLLWDVVRTRWADSARLLTIQAGSAGTPSFFSKSKYALALAGIQATDASDWILFSHLGLAKPLAGIPRRWRKPYAVFLHGIEVWRPLTPGERRILTEAALRISNSEYTSARVMEMHPEIGPVSACPLALPPDRVGGGQDGGAASGFDCGPHDVLTVGRMLSAERYKGHDQLIEAWPRVRSAVPDARLIIVGDGDDVPRLRAKAAQGAARDAIVFTGFVSGRVLQGLYARAALFALPSRGEGFGLVYLEAMAQRLACVGSTHDAAREVIADGRTGRLVDQGNTRALSDTIAELLVDEKRRTEMGAAGYLRATGDFSFDRFSDRLCQLLSGASIQEAV